MAAILPLRFRILHYLHLAGDKPVTTKEIYDALYDEYTGEGQFSMDLMEDHLMSIKAVGLIEATDPYFDEDEEARYKYRIPDAGRDRTKYLPKQL